MDLSCLLVSRALVLASLATLLLNSCAVAPVGADARPNIVIIGTGGTIAGASVDGDISYVSGSFSVGQIVTAVPKLSAVADIKVEQISNTPSQDMTNDVWLALAERVSDLIQTPMVDGIVVTHGTDTIEETSYFLDLVVPGQKPVVLVGAMRPPDAELPDGPRNLLDAVTVASHPKSHNRPVMVVMNGDIHSARRVTKAHPTALDAFRSPGFGPIGSVVHGRVTFVNTSEEAFGRVGRFAITDQESLPVVEILYGYANVSPFLVTAAVEYSVEGIVYAGVGNGNIHKRVLPYLEKAVDEGVFVCRSTRVFDGRLAIPGEVNDQEYGFVVSPHVNAQKSRVLLMLALTISRDREEVARILLGAE